jgi:nitrous oxidase accessory protein NosD
VDRITISLAGLLLLSTSSTTDAASYVVNPGVGTLQAAIDAASPGDTLKLEFGTYTGAVDIDKSLNIVGPAHEFGNPASALIDAECLATAALQITADEVKIQRVTVRGGSFYTIDIDGRTDVQLKEVVPLEGAFGCGGVEYGINIFNSSGVKIINCDVIGDNNGYTGVNGYVDAGIYIGGIPSDGKVSVKKSFVIGNNRGVIVEDSAPVGSGSIRVQKCGIAGNDTGIFVGNSDGVRILANAVNDGQNSGALVGIELDATSDDNVIKKNSFMNAVTDILDNGTSNCWINNTFVTGTLPPDGCH